MSLVRFHDCDHDPVFREDLCSTVCPTSPISFNLSPLILVLLTPLVFLLLWVRSLYYQPFRNDDSLLFSFYPICIS